MAFLDETGLAELWSLICNKHDGFANEYVWAKTASETADVVNPKGELWQNLSIYKDGAGSLPAMSSLKYGKSAKIVNGSVVLDEVFTPTSQPISGNAAYWQSIVPFYFSYNNKIYYASAYIGANSNNVIVEAYYTSIVQETIVTNYGYVNSPDPNAYPPAVSDGYTYVALGQLGNKVQIATGSYTGTGTYGASNPNSLTFDFTPKIVFVGCGQNPGVFPYVWGASMFINQQNNTTSYNPAAVTGNTLSWYHASNNTLQLNQANVVYYYVAIG